MPVPPACTGPAILHAYNAGSLATEYWNSAQATGNRDQARGNAVKFVPPTIVTGKVYADADRGRRVRTAAQVERILHYFKATARVGLP